jgi:hypothetical protein
MRGSLPPGYALRVVGLQGVLVLLLLAAALLFAAGAFDDLGGAAGARVEEAAEVPPLRQEPAPRLAARAPHARCDDPACPRCRSGVAPPPPEALAFEPDWASYALRGRVVDAESGDPVTDARVFLWPADQPRPEDPISEG